MICHCGIDLLDGFVYTVTLSHHTFLCALKNFTPEGAVFFLFFLNGKVKLYSNYVNCIKTAKHIHYRKTKLQLYVI